MTLLEPYNLPFAAAQFFMLLLAILQGAGLGDMLGDADADVDTDFDRSSLGALVQGAANETNGSDYANTALESGGIEGVAASNDESEDSPADQVAE